VANESTSLFADGGGRRGFDGCAGAVASVGTAEIPAAWAAQRSGVKWLTGAEELYDNASDPYQMNNLATNQRDLPRLQKMRKALKDLLAQAHDEFLSGIQYADWYDDQRNLIRTALGPV